MHSTHIVICAPLWPFDNTYVKLAYGSNIIFNKLHSNLLESKTSKNNALKFRRGGCIHSSDTNQLYDF